MSLKEAISKRFFKEPTEIEERQDVVFTPDYSEPVLPQLPEVEEREPIPRAGAPTYEEPINVEHEETPWVRHKSEPGVKEVPLKTMREKIYEWGQKEHVSGKAEKEIIRTAKKVGEIARDRVKESGLLSSGLDDKQYEMKMRALAVKEKRARVAMARENVEYVRSARRSRAHPQRSVYNMTRQPNYQEHQQEFSPNREQFDRNNFQGRNYGFRPRGFPRYRIVGEVQIPRTGVYDRHYTARIYPKAIDTSYYPPHHATAPFKKRYGINIKKGEPFQPHWIGFNWQTHEEEPMPGVHFKKRRFETKNKGKKKK